VSEEEVDGQEKILIIQALSKKSTGGGKALCRVASDEHGRLALLTTRVIGNSEITG